MWALGVVFYELLYGEPPFEGSDKNEKMNNIYSNKWEFKDDIREISAEAKKLLRHVRDKI